jgi:hypothetical protein
MEEFEVDKALKDLIHRKLFAFGPYNYGPNLLILNWINEEESFLN